MAEEQRRKKAEYNKKARESGRPKRFSIEFPGDDSVKENIKIRIAKVKELLSSVGTSKVFTNTDIISQVLDFYIHRNTPQEQCNNQLRTEPSVSPGFEQVDREEVDQPLFVTAIQSVKNLCKIISEHATNCPNCILDTNEKYKRGHVSVLNIVCETCSCELQNWPSSPYLPNNKFLVNYRVAHGFLTSGMIPVQYQRFAEFSDIGCLSESFIREHFLPDFNLSVDFEYRESCNDALANEVSS